jgi:hypothetical protein
LLNALGSGARPDSRRQSPLEALLARFSDSFVSSLHEAVPVERSSNGREATSTARAQISDFNIAPIRPDFQVPHGVPRAEASLLDNQFD